MTDSSSRAAPSATGRYSRAAIVLHWTIAALVLVQLGLGWTMNELLPDHTPRQAFVQSIHISLGLTILLLVLVRIVVRLAQRPPPPPAGTPAWERLVAGATHLLFYVLLLALPLTGWAIVSLGNQPISFWGLPWPHLPGVGALLGNPAPKPVRHALSHIHVYILIWIVLLNLALHVGAAIKHQFDGHPVLWRMTGLKQPAR
ncbi:MAG TPA: cytochrome b/b6 domain-containing protein [Caulobacteraceae bacterium]|jgi:cytochrome b561|nr:cytochrome b/b6 domain-containing protein [Caulobacteraceae bacterium]